MDGFTLIADPTRRRILDALRAEDRDVTMLITLLGVPQSLVSKHLRVLREAGAVTAVTDGRRRVYRLAVDPLPDVLGWVSPYHRLWSGGFDRLADALDADARAEGRSPGPGTPDTSGEKTGQPPAGGGGVTARDDGQPDAGRPG